MAFGARGETRRRRRELQRSAGVQNFRRLETAAETEGGDRGVHAGRRRGRAGDGRRADAETYGSDGGAPRIQLPRAVQRWPAANRGGQRVWVRRDDVVVVGIDDGRKQENVAVCGHGQRPPDRDREQSVDGVPAVAAPVVRVVSVADAVAVAPPHQLHHGRGRPQVPGQRTGRRGRRRGLRDGRPSTRHVRVRAHVRAVASVPRAAVLRPPPDHRVAAHAHVAVRHGVHSVLFRGDRLAL